MDIKAFKMDGLGNDFVIIDNREKITNLTKDQIIKICDRNFIGCDQLIFIETDSSADANLKFFNSDGGESGACGNGTRCVANLISNEKNNKSIILNTLSGKLKSEILEKKIVTTEIGKAKLKWDEIPLSKEMDTKNLNIKIIDTNNNEHLGGTAINVGNPHIVFFVKKIEDFNIEKIGPEIENHEIFPEKCNVTIAQIFNKNLIKVKVWERGAGLTKACGTAACAKEKGLSAMFTMMNLERIVVGIQGLGISEIAYQNSLTYAKERKQGKSNNSSSKNGADFIIEHADIRRTLLNMKSIIEGERALCFWLSQQTEVSLNHPDEKTRQEASDYVSLMTPVVKSLFTDLAMEITSDAMQIHGGYGYTKDQGIEQLYRDNRITPIYEGTNSVQASDLVFRKLSNKNGNIINKFLDQVKAECKTDNEKIKPFLLEFNKNLDTLKKFSDWMIDKATSAKDDVSAAANDYLKTLGYVSIAYAWIKVLEVSFEDYEENKDFYNDKIDTARFYFDKVLPRAEHHYKSAISGSSNIMNFKFN